MYGSISFMVAITNLSFNVDCKCAAYGNVHSYMPISRYYENTKLMNTNRISITRMIKFCRFMKYLASHFKLVVQYYLFSSLIPFFAYLPTVHSSRCCECNKHLDIHERAVFITQGVS